MRSRLCIRTLVIVSLGLVSSLLLPRDAAAGDIYGQIRFRDLETGKERPITRQIAIAVDASHQRVETTSKPGARYYLSVDEDGRFPLHVKWAGRTLTTEVGSFYHPNRYDLIIETKYGEYRLVAKFVREHHTRPQDKG